MTLYTLAARPDGRSRVTRNAGPASSDALTRFVFEHSAVRGALREPRRRLPRHPRLPSLSAGAEARARGAARRGGAACVHAQVQGRADRPAPGRRTGAPARRRMRRGARAARHGAMERRGATRCPPMPRSPNSPAGRTTVGSRSRSIRRTAGPLYQGIVALEATSIAALVEHYLTTSEQIVEPDGDRSRGRPACAACSCSGCPAPTSDDDATWALAAAHRDGGRAGRPLLAGAPRRCFADCFPRRTTSACSGRGRPASRAAARRSASRTRCGCSAGSRSRASLPSGASRRDLRILQSQLHLVADEARALFADRVVPPRDALPPI